MPPSTPTRKTPKRNKVEVSPNNRAKCHQCKAKIVKGTERYGIVEDNPPWGCSQRYYHPNCCPESLKKKLPSPAKRQKDAVREQQQKAILNEHPVLYEQLRRLRMEFANRLEVEPYKVYQNQSLDDLVCKMPTTEAQLLNVWGIKEKRAQSFGSAILAVIQQYQDSLNPPQHDNGGDDEVVVLTKTLTCEEIVNQKFQHAQANGYVIAVD